MDYIYDGRPTLPEFQEDDSTDSPFYCHGLNTTTYTEWLGLWSRSGPMHTPSDLSWLLYEYFPIEFDPELDKCFDLIKENGAVRPNETFDRTIITRQELYQWIRQASEAETYDIERVLITIEGIYQEGVYDKCKDYNW